MSIIIKAANPTGLLAAIKKGIADKSIRTWSCDADGDFTHTPDQWDGKAWLRPSTATVGELRLSIVKNEKVAMTKTISGVFQGRFIEMLVTHFEASFTSATAIIP